MLGARLERRFVLADALHVVAREQGADSFVCARRLRAPRPDPAAFDAARPHAAQAEDGTQEVNVDTGFAYRDGEPVLVTIRRRGHRHDIDGGGGAIARSGRPPGWGAAAERAVLSTATNVSRTTGIVFVPGARGP